MYTRRRFAMGLSSLVVGGSAVAREMLASHRAAQPNRSPLVRIDAVITDSLGRSIDDLSPHDLQVLEQGTVRPIHMAQFRGMRRHSTVALHPLASAVDERRAAADIDARVFAFYLDEFSVSPGVSTERVREHVTEFVDNKLFARDLAAIVRPGDSIDAVRFTRDRALLHASIAHFTGQAADRAAGSPDETDRMREPSRPPSVHWRLTCDRLRELALRLGALGAERAVIVVISESHTWAFVAADHLAAELEPIARAASRFHITIYAFDPSSEPPTAAVRAAAPVETGLDQLAIKTGGLAVRSDRLIFGFARVYHDTETSYAITFEPLTGSHEVHDLELRVLRRHALVRSPTRYWPTPDSLWATNVAYPARFPSEAQPSLRQSPVIEVWAGVRPASDAQLELTVVWEPRRRVGPRPTSVHLTASNTDGAALFTGELGPARVPPSAASDCARFAVTPGRVMMQLSIRDANGTELDTDARYVDVVAQRMVGSSAAPALWTQTIRRRSWADVVKAATDSNATPSATRTFGRRDHLLVRVYTFGSHGAMADMIASVFNRAGRSLREVERLPDLTEPAAAQFVLPLSWLPPDDYHLEVRGTNIHGTVRDQVNFHLVD